LSPSSKGAFQWGKKKKKRKLGSQGEGGQGEERDTFRKRKKDRFFVYLTNQDAGWARKKKEKMGTGQGHPKKNEHAFSFGRKPDDLKREKRGKREKKNTGTFQPCT